MTAAGVVLAVVVGLLLRTYQFSDQILADDEWHAIHALRLDSYVWIFSHFGKSDHSIPLTLLYKALADTVGLTENRMRAPMLLCGIAALAVFPLLVRRCIGSPAAAAFAWLLAISPLHVYFSRYARPYAITMFLAGVAVVAAFEWRSSGSRRWAAVYAGAAVVAPYFHLAVLPAVLAPLLFAITEWAAGPALGRRRPLRPVLAVGGIVAAGLTALLIVPVVVDADALTGKAGMSRTTAATFAGAAQLLAGSADLRVVVAMALLSLGGAVVLARRAPRLVLYFGLVAACQLAPPLLTHPTDIGVPIVLVRYCLPLLPVFLACVAVGLVASEEVARRAVPAWPRGALPTVVVGGLFAFGPLPAIYHAPNNWTNHALYQYTYDPTDPHSPAEYVRPKRLPDFYRRLAAQPPGSLLIVEAPWHYAWAENPYPHLQAVHRQRMQVGFVATRDRFQRAGEWPDSDSRIRFRNALHVADAAELRERRVRYVIFHRHLLDELPGRRAASVDVEPWIRQYTRDYGAPVYDDAEIAVFDVAPHSG